MTDTKRRGRPRRSPATKEQDEVIAKTAYRLLVAGWSGRSRPLAPGVFEIVGIEAENILGRTDGDRGELGPDRVEQIFKAWRSTEQKRRSAARAWPLVQVFVWGVSSLRERAPVNVGDTLNDQAKALLLNAGEWPPSAQFRKYLGDMVPTPVHAKWIEDTIPRFAPATPPTEDEMLEFAQRFVASVLAAQKNGVEK